MRRGSPRGRARNERDPGLTRNRFKANDLWKKVRFWTLLYAIRIVDSGIPMCYSLLPPFCFYHGVGLFKRPEFSFRDLRRTVVYIRHHRRIRLSKQHSLQRWANRICTSSKRNPKSHQATFNVSIMIVFQWRNASPDFHLFSFDPDDNLCFSVVRPLGPIANRQEFRSMISSSSKLFIDRTVHASA